MAEGKPIGSWRPYVAAENGWSRMIRSRRFKYCAYNAPDNNESLVDMENDPGEMRNLVHAPDFRDVLLKHRRYLAEWIKRSNDREGGRWSDCCT